MAHSIFLGRTEEQQQFRRVLKSLRPSWVQRHLPTFSKPFRRREQNHDQLPYILLFHGEGGMGKSTLLRRLSQTAEGTVKEDARFRGEFNVLFMDWEEQRTVVFGTEKK